MSGGICPALCFKYHYSDGGDSVALHWFPSGEVYMVGNRKDVLVVWGFETCAVHVLGELFLRF